MNEMLGDALAGIHLTSENATYVAETLDLTTGEVEGIETLMELYPDRPIYIVINRAPYPHVWQAMTEEHLKKFFRFPEGEAKDKFAKVEAL